MATAQLIGESIESRERWAQREILDCLLMVADAAWGNKDWLAAARAYELVNHLDGRNTHALNRLGRLNLIDGKVDSALDCFSEAYVKGASDPATCVNLAVAYARQGDVANALLWCRNALAFEAAFLPALVQMGAIYDDVCQHEDAEKVFDAALERYPDNPNLHFGRAVERLSRGDWKGGWEDYEFRPDRMQLVRQLDEYPEWKGEPLQGRTLLVAREQGLGDQIMFSRYLPWLAELGAHIVLYTYPELGRLMQRSYPFVRIATCDRDLETFEPDYWVGIGSLPLRFGGSWIAEGGIAPVYRLQYDSLARARFEARIVGAKDKFRVGICWQGQKKHQKDSQRSIPWEQVRSLTENLPAVEFYSLQFGPDASDLPSLAAYCHDFADTAAAISALDVVVTVDTAMLHLAASLGKPTLGLLYRPFEWRWGREKRDSLWYPSLTQLRQSEKGEWGPVLQHARELLAGYAKQPWHRGSVILENRQPCSSGECRYGKMTWPRNDHYIGRALDLYGEYSESELELLRKVLKPGDTVVDVGANVGGLTLGMAAQVGAGGRVYAIEPQPLYFDCLMKAAADTKNIAPFWIAAGIDSRRITMRRVEEETIHAPGWPSTGPEFEVQQHSIDSLSLSSCALVKVDVDGPEHEILKGAEKTIDRFRPVIYVEYDKPDEYPEMLDWLLAKGYRIYQHNAPLFNPKNFRGNPVNVFGKIVSVMMLCIPDERKDMRFPGLARVRSEMPAL